MTRVGTSSPPGLFRRELIARFGAFSSSGGAYALDGRLWVTGHDARELYVLELPAGGGVALWAGAVGFVSRGQAFAWDPTRPQELYSIQRKTREVIVSRYARVLPRGFVSGGVWADVGLTPMRAIVCLLCATLGLFGAEPGLVRTESIFEKNPVPSCHATTIVEARDGSLVAAWFAGEAEGKPDVSIWVARQVSGKWTAPVKVAEGTQLDGSALPLLESRLVPAEGRSASALLQSRS
jgi:hypothetical protein